MLVLLALASILVPAGSYLLIHYVLEPKITEQQTAFLEHLPRIKEDLEQIDLNPPFPNISFNQNAEQVLKNHISWQSDEIVKPEFPENALLAAVFGKSNQWRSNPAELQKIIDNPKLKNLDTTWVRQLAAYDHWNISINDAVREQIASVSEKNGLSKIGVFAALPIPVYSDVRKWGIVNLLQARNKKSALAALKDYRHLARLVYTSSSLVASMHATQMLNDEHYFVSTLGIKGWDLIPKEQIAIFKRLSWGWVGVAQSPIYGTFPEEFRRFIKAENGICGSAWETTVVGSFQDFLIPQAPFEMNYTDKIENSVSMSKLLQKSCNLESYQTFHQRSPAGANGWVYGKPNHLGENNPLFFENVNWSAIPYARRVAFNVMLAVGTPNYTKLYDMEVK